MHDYFYRMTLKEIIKQTISIISSPTNTWEKLSNEIDDTSKNDVFFFYSLLVANMIAVIFGTFFNGIDFPIVTSILKALIWGVAIYGGYWGVYYILNEVLYKRHFIEIEALKSNRLIYYSFALTLSLHMITFLFPNLEFLKIGLIYTLFIVWEGVGKMLPTLNENERSNFVLILSGSIILLPIVIYQCLILFVPAAQ